METPPRDEHTLTERRTTRSALAEIPVRLDMLSVNENGRFTTPTHSDGEMNGTHIPGRWHMNVSINVPSSLVSPSPSPDEQVIQQRGRRRMPVTWSPDVDAHKQNGPTAPNRTPVKGSPAKSSIVLRSTPRKRLLLSDPKELFGTPEKIRKMSPNSKKVSSDKYPPNCTGTIDMALQALSPEQLIGVMKNIIDSHPELEEEVWEKLPSPDMRPFEERLSDLKKNIFKSLPSSRLTSKTDSPAYSRAATHLSAFKKCVFDQSRQLVSSQNWNCVMEYVLMAWMYVRLTPLWDNPPHNTTRRQCFRHLAAQCMTALKKGTWTEKQCEVLEDKLGGMVPDCEDVQMCLKYVIALKKKL
ncbi:uncharacterized protein [Anabrus simplex]|uniref:uncharacterized protein isoform X2 n=1 Tax=Anabrus simplex TaxID=316456 RepID=UPI0034DD3E92